MPANDLISNPVRGQMKRLRRGIRARLLGEGAASVVTALMGLVLVTLLCDWGLHRLTLQPVAVGQRALIGLLALAGVGYVAWRRLIRRSMVRLGDEHVALVVERHYPRLDDRLISAVQFSAADWTADATISAPLVRRMAEQVNAAASGLDFLAPIDRRGLRKQMVLALAAILVIAGIAAASPTTMLLWFQRNVLLQDVPWPRETYLTMINGPEYRVARGGELTVRVAVEPHSEVKPTTVMFHVRYDTAGTVDEPVEIHDGIGEKTFRDVTEPFTFHATGNDGRTKTCRVTVVDPPELTHLKLTVEYPGYMNLGPRDFDGLRGAVTIPPGSWVTVEAAATKALSSANFLLDGVKVGQPELKRLPATAGDGASSDMAPGVTGRFRLDVPGSHAAPSTAPASATPARPAGPQTMALRLDLGHTDDTGFQCVGQAAVTIHVDYDKAPNLKVNWLALTKKITQVAMAPLAVDADDRHGLTGLIGNVSVKGISREPMALPIEGAGESGPSPVGPDGQIKPARRRVVLPQALIDLKPLGLELGETVQIWVEAVDSLPADMGGPNRRRSDLREFKIVTEKELMAELLKQQKQMRVRMQQALSGQGDARDRSRAAADQASVNNTAEVQRLIGQSARKQQNVAGLAASIAYTYQTIFDIMKYNRAGKEDERMEMATQIIAPLDKIVGETIPALQTRIDAAVRSVGEPANEGQLRQVYADQEKLYDQLDRIMQKMVQLESIRELARLLTDVLGDSTSIGQGIRDRLRAATSGAFDPNDESTTQPATPPDR